MREGVRVQIIILGFLLSAVNCGPLTDPDNGQVDTSNGTTFGSTATYTCHKESGSRTCGADGLWTSAEPNCQGKNRNNYHAEAMKLPWVFNLQICFFHLMTALVLSLLLL